MRSPKREEPKWGRLRGMYVLLETAEENLGQADLEQVEVEIEPGKTIRPWRFASSGADIVINPDGSFTIF